MHPDISPIEGRFAKRKLTEAQVLRQRINALPEAQQIALATETLCRAASPQSVQQLRLSANAATMAADDIEKGQALQRALSVSCNYSLHHGLPTSHTKWID